MLTTRSEVPKSSPIRRQFLIPQEYLSVSELNYLIPSTSRFTLLEDIYLLKFNFRFLISSDRLSHDFRKALSERLQVGIGAAGVIEAAKRNQLGTKSTREGSTPVAPIAL